MVAARASFGVASVLAFWVCVSIGTAAAQTSSQIIEYLNDDLGPGVFTACGASNGDDSWDVMLCVPRPSVLPPNIRRVMGPGVGYQAIQAMKALEREYRGRVFYVIVRSDVQQYGYAFRDERGDAVYKEEREYR
jgi:hypothetical protein